MTWNSNEHYIISLMKVNLIESYQFLLLVVSVSVIMTLFD